MKTFPLSLLLIIATLSASANEKYGSYVDDPNLAFDASVTRAETVSVTWRKVSKADLQAACAAESKKRGFRPMTDKMQACSFWNGNECTIITPKYTTMHTVGHEFRHCFQGKWH